MEELSRCDIHISNKTPINTSALNNDTLDSNTVSNDTPTYKNTHILRGSWTQWAHLPHDTDWGVDSYKKIITFNTLEEAIALGETLPVKMIKNCMLFLMRDGIHPTWEDVKNKTGGCFSYKISNKIIASVWKDLSYLLVGETLTSNKELMNDINGITISPKKNFCVLKIWISNCKWQNPKLITDVKGVSSQGCLFKRHLV